MLPTFESAHDNLESGVSPFASLITLVRRTIMTVTAPTRKHTFTERAAAGNLNDAQILNPNNAAGSDLPNESDVVVAGGGIHGLIYAIRAAKYKPGNLKISLIEKSSKPRYKIGESTLPLLFSVVQDAWSHGRVPLASLASRMDCASTFSTGRLIRNRVNDFKNNNTKS